MNRRLKAQQEAEAMMFLAAIMGYGMAGLRKGTPILTEREKKSRKCLLPSCAALTTHNGGYCCAEHCKQHRADTSNPTREPRAAE